MIARRRRRYLYVDMLHRDRAIGVQSHTRARTHNVTASAGQPRSRSYDLANVSAAIRYTSPPPGYGIAK